MNPSRKLLCVAAWEPELEQFRTLVSDRDLLIEGVGVGIVQASVGMTRCVVRHAPTHALLLGTGGAAPGSGLAIGDVVVARDLHFVDAAVAEARGAMPFVSTDAPLDAGLSEALAGAGARPASVVTTPSVTTDDHLASKLSAFG